jgi:hypothetical protein
MFILMCLVYVWSALFDLNFKLKNIYYILKSSITIASNYNLLDSASQIILLRKTVVERKKKLFGGPIV